jgi:hypothetical protein
MNGEEEQKKQARTKKKRKRSKARETEKNGYNGFFDEHRSQGN